MSDVLIWSIAAGTIGGILFRPRDWPEAVWACVGAVLLVLCGLLPIPLAMEAIGKGTDVYLFLTGMMLLSELARREGLFDWLASRAVAVAKGSPSRLFLLIYIVGVFVTIFLSNDATAVVLTPAVYAAMKEARTKPLPYLLICAFIANAASFVLPISNPANLVVYGKQLPPLIPWLETFALPSVLSIVTTYVALRLFVRNDIAGESSTRSSGRDLSTAGKMAAWSIVVTGIVLITASGLGKALGLPTLLAASISVLIATRINGSEIAGIAKGVSWSVLPLVAGLFVLVEALNRSGARRDIVVFLRFCEGVPKAAGALVSSFGMAALSNVVNNLPSGLLAGGALQSLNVPAHIRDSVLLGVDLGPNLSVTGSLATILWLIAARREGEKISGWQFLKAGMVVMPPALILATLALSLLSN